MRPWAAKKGIQLLQEACRHSTHLKDDDFKRLIRAVERCILHVIGGRGATDSPTTSSSSAAHTEFKTSYSMIDASAAALHYMSGIQQRRSEPQLADIVDRNKAGGKMTGTQSGGTFTLRRSSRSNQHQLTQQQQQQQQQQQRQQALQPPCSRFFKECLQTDKARERELLEKRYIGKILDQQRNQHVITVTEVNFRWQLGLLIGKLAVEV